MLMRFPPDEVNPLKPILDKSYNRIMDTSSESKGFHTTRNEAKSIDLSKHFPFTEASNV